MLEKYIGAKIIQAEPMDRHNFIVRCKGGNIPEEENMDGYKVIYPDGYTSWSPKSVFEEAYRKISAAEMALIN